MTSIQQKGLPSERVQGPPSVNTEYLDCVICRDILWKPVACQTCETPYCSVCVEQWLINNPTKCPNRCEVYIERKCPPFIAKLLSQLQIACFYQSNGCQEVMPYEALDKHEIECGYQYKQCPGCELKMFKKDLSDHKTNCELIQLTCKNCKLMYRRNEATTKHTKEFCLKKQLKRLHREAKESKHEIQNLKSQLTEMHKLQSLLTREVITFDDLPSAVNQLLDISTKYKGFKWEKISYMHESYATKHYPKSGYITSFLPGGSLHVAYTRTAASISVAPPNETFTLISLMACSAWNDDLQLGLTAYRNSLEVDYREVTLLFGRPQRICLQWKNIDKVTLASFGGTAHPESGEAAGYQVVLTQIIIDNLTKGKK